ncbi:MAG: helix-turn-helix domain containing protein [Olivibacter sp.]|nr:helix-turn-helix domain containing protein [Olivibacter sp. UJ_SKK_5.1]
MSRFLDKSLILSRIKFAYGIKSDLKLAEFLGIPPTTLSSWKRRNTIDFDLLYSKLVDISWDHLIYGIGEPFLSTKYKEDLGQVETTPPEDHEDKVPSLLPPKSTAMIIDILTAEIEKLRVELSEKDANQRNSG